MNNKELNAKLADLDDHHPEFTPEALKAFSKVLPYYGFGWKFINFDKPMMLGVSPYTIENGQEFVPWVGFMAREKRSHRQWQATAEQATKLKEILENFATTPSLIAATEIYDYLQGCRVD
jgi:hypothetical protein